MREFIKSLLPYIFMVLTMGCSVSNPISVTPPEDMTIVGTWYHDYGTAVNQDSIAYEFRSDSTFSAKYFYISGDTIPRVVQSGTWYYLTDSTIDFRFQTTHYTLTLVGDNSYLKLCTTSDTSRPYRKLRRIQ